MIKKTILCICILSMISAASAGIYYAGSNSPAGANQLNSTTDMKISTRGNSTASVSLNSYSLEVANVYISPSDKATGTLSLQKNSQLTCYGNMTVGAVGFGKVEVKSGSNVITNNTYIQTDNSMSWGRAYVDGDGSTWENGGDWTMGGTTNRYASLDITNNALVKIGGNFTAAGSYSYITVKTGGRMTVGGTLNFADAVVKIEDGKVSAGSVFAKNYSAQSDSVTEIILGGSSFGIHAEENLNAAGTLQISLAEDFLITGSTVFDILDWSTLTGEFDSVILPKLDDASLSWDISNLYNDGTIAVVPEPATMLLLGMGVVLSVRKK